jgi:hypothetical protein
MFAAFCYGSIDPTDSNSQECKAGPDTYQPKGSAFVLCRPDLTACVRSLLAPLAREYGKGSRSGTRGGDPLAP